MKKALSLVLSVVMLLSVIAGMNITAFAGGEVSLVAVNKIDRPYAGNKPDYTAAKENINHTGYDIDTTVYNNGVLWSDVTDEIDEEYLDPDDVFVAGHTYKVYVRVAANSDNGWYFKTDRSTGLPDVTCSLDYTEAEAQRVDGQLATQGFDVVFTFLPTTAETTINEVSVTNFKFPGTGEKASTSFTLGDTLSYSLVTDDVNNPYLINNKVEWYDLDTHENLSANDTFITGHNYSFYIRIKANDGYVFPTEKSPSGTINPSPAVYVNGEKCIAQRFCYYHAGKYEASNKFLQIYGTYYCTENLKSVSFTGTDTFEDGYAPNFSAYSNDTSKYDVYTSAKENDGEYVINGVAYYDNTAKAYVKKNEPFIIGHEYYKQIAVYQKTGGYIIGKNTAMYYNGKASINSKKFIGKDAYSDNSYISVIQAYLGKCTRNIKDCYIVGVSSNFIYTYSGKAKKAVQDISYAGEYLTPGTDYTVSYTNNINAGTASYTVTGKGNYSGTVKGTFKIVRKALSNSAKVTLSGKNYTYDGKVKKPTVKVYDGDKLLKSGTDYSLKYSNSSSKTPGEYTIKITFKGNYSGSKTITYTILPKGTTLLKTASTGKNWISPQWTKQTTQTTGYEIMYSRSAGFRSGNETVLVTNNTQTVKKITGLKKNTKYYFKIRTYKTVKVNGINKRICSAWSPVKEFKTKK